jgi:hypothetical protein
MQPAVLIGMFIAAAVFAVAIIAAVLSIEVFSRLVFHFI